MRVLRGHVHRSLVFDSFGGAFVAADAPCDGFAISIELPEGDYSADATLVDDFNHAVSVTLPLDGLRVIEDTELTINVDFPPIRSSRIWARSCAVRRRVVNSAHEHDFMALRRLGSRAHGGHFGLQRRTAQPAGPGAPSGSPAASSAPSAAPLDTPAGPDAAPSGSASADAPPPANSLVAHLEEAKAPTELGPNLAKLLAIAKISPNTHKGLLKHMLWTPKGECPTTAVVDLKPPPGLLVASGKPIKVRDKTAENLKAAGALAKQRGLAIEVVAGHITIKDAVTDWNHAIIEKAHALAKAASPADQKEKSFASDARKALGEEGPRSWNKSSCEVGRFGGWSVFVQLVTVDASEKRGQVLVKAGDEGEHFSKRPSSRRHWDKPKGKNFRMLTEIMSAGKFVRQCSQPYLFFTSPTQDGTWRCKQDTESWDPENRPLPAWQ